MKNTTQSTQPTGSWLYIISSRIAGLAVGVVVFFLVREPAETIGWGHALVISIGAGMAAFFIFFMLLDQIQEKNLLGFLLVVAASFSAICTFVLVRAWIANNIRLDSNVQLIFAGFLTLLIVAVPLEQLTDSVPHDIRGFFLYLSIIVGGIIAFLWVRTYLESINWRSQDGITQTAIAILPTGGCVMWLLSRLQDTQCPSCKHIAVRETLRTEKIDSRKGYKAVEREEKNRDGEVIRRWQEQVRVLTTTYMSHYRCRQCKHVWSKTFEEETETFDD